MVLIPRQKYFTSIGHHNSGPNMKPSEPIYNAKAEAQIKTNEKLKKKLKMQNLKLTNAE